MKKLSLTIICALSVLFFASCQTGDKKDANGNTPSDVVEKMYKAIQTNDFELAASFNKIPDTVKINKENAYTQFAGNPTDKKDDKKIVVTGEEWKSFLIERMKSMCEQFTLVSYEIIAEEISNTDPNSAKVKTKITTQSKNGQNVTECSFPLKRENNIWVIIG